MKIEETYEFWYDYISNNPNKTYCPNHKLWCAPYLDLQVFLNADESGLEHFVFFQKEKIHMHWHRLDGPAVIDTKQYVQFWVHNLPLNKEDWKNNKDVISFKINRIIVEVLGEQ